MGKEVVGPGASGVGSKVWILSIGVLEVNPERDSILAQRGHAQSALFSRVVVKNNLFNVLKIRSSKHAYLKVLMLQMETIQYGSPAGSCSTLPCIRYI